MTTEPVRFWFAYWPHSSSAANELSWGRVESAELIERGDTVYLYDRSPPGLVGWAEVTSKESVERIYDDGDEEGVTPPYNTYSTLEIRAVQRGWLRTAVGVAALSRHEELRSIRRLVSHDSADFELLRGTQARILSAVLADNGCVALPNLTAQRSETLFNDPTEPSRLPVAVTDCWREIKIYFARHPEKLYQLEPGKFEGLVAEILKDLGFETKLTSLTRDGGCDIYAHVRNVVTSFLMFVECKRWSPNRKVGIEVVQRIYGAAKAGGAHQSMVVTTSFFSRPAIEEQKKMSAELVLADYNTLKTWLARYQNDG